MKRWINTLVLFDALGRVIKQEGYWYDGPMALAVAMIATDQDSFAFYNDGTESGATIIGSKNVAPTLEVDTTYHCRILIEETGGATGNVNGRVFEYELNNSGTWVTVTTSSAVVIAVDGGLTDGADTTSRITNGGTFDSTNGWQSEDGTLSNNSLPANNECEAVLAFQIVSGDVVDDDVVKLRISDMDAYTREAELIVNEAVSTRRIFVVG